jgi:hypothetical protein
MKNIYHSLLAILALVLMDMVGFPEPGKAQITLTQASYSNVTLGVDSFRSVTAFTAVPSNNALWDLAGATYGSSITTFTRTAVSGNSTYPSATYSVPTSYKFNTLLAYNATDMNGIVSAGQQSYGQVLARQAISLTPLTTGANDSLVFNQQNIVYSSPKKIISFPASAGSTWNSSYVWDLSFSLTVASASLNKVPGIKRGYVTYTDSVVGWGKMRVKNALGQNTGWLDVLAIKVTYQQKDSFFLNAAPAPASLLATFGLTQGQVSNQYSIVYNRAQQPGTLLSITYTDGTFSTPVSSTVHARDLPAATAVAYIPFNDRVKIYPNPVTNGTFSIQIDGANSKPYSYELTSALGQVISGGTLNLSKGKATIHLDQPAGTYFLQLAEEGAVVGIQQLELR